MEDESRNSKALRTGAVLAAIAVYCISVLYGDIMFISIMQQAFPSGFLGSMAVVGAVATAASCIVLPLAKWKWFRNGNQMMFSWAFWAVEFGVLMLNSMLAYQYSMNQELDTVFTIWAMISPATPLICGLGWGLLFFLDESSTREHADKEMQDRMYDTFDKEFTKAIRSPEVNSMLTNGAVQSAREYAERLLNMKLSDNSPAVQVLPAKTVSRVRSYAQEVSAVELDTCALCGILVTVEEKQADKVVHSSSGAFIHRACLAQAVSPKPNPTTGDES